MRLLLKYVAIFFLSTFILTSNSFSKVIKIQLPAHIPPSYVDMYTSFKRFTDRVNQLGKGKVQIQLYHSQKLYKVKEIVPALMNGSVDMILHTNTHTTGSWPEIGGLSLPFLYESEYEAAKKWKIGGDLLKLVNTEMEKKYGVRVLVPGIMPGFQLWTVKKEVNTPEDLKGMKIRGTGVPDAALAKSCGAATTYISSSEMYEALQRGTVDGMITYPGTVYARRLHEILKFETKLNPMLCVWGYQIYARSKVFDSWPKDVQDIILTAGYEYDYRHLQEALKYFEKVLDPEINKRMKIIKPTATAMDEFKKHGEKIQQDWLKTVDNKFGNEFLKLSKQN